MKARYLVIGGAVFAMAARGIAACSFGPDAYTGPDPLTPEEAGLEAGDDGSMPGDDGSSSESSNGDGGLSGDGSLRDGAPDGRPPDGGAPEGGRQEGGPQEGGVSEGGMSDSASDGGALSDTSGAAG